MRKLIHALYTYVQRKENFYTLYIYGHIKWSIAKASAIKKSIEKRKSVPSSGVKHARTLRIVDMYLFKVYNTHINIIINPIHGICDAILVALDVTLSGR